MLLKWRKQRRGIKDIEKNTIWNKKKNTNLRGITEKTVKQNSSIELHEIFVFIFSTAFQNL